MAKAPRGGASKTRLVPPLTAGEAAGLSAALIRDAAENIAAAARHAAIDGFIACSPPEAADEFAALLADGTRLLPLPRSGLGASLHDAAAALLAAGYGAACLINSDSPTLPTRVLIEAARALCGPADRVVLGPAEDGGYYLIGLKRMHARLFEEIAWSTQAVLAQTVARAREIGLEPLLLPQWYDIDDVASLLRLRAELAADAAARRRARHTAALLHELFGPAGNKLLRERGGSLAAGS